MSLVRRHDTESGPTMISSSSASFGKVDAATAVNNRFAMSFQIMTDERRALVLAYRKVTLAPLAAERQNRYACSHEVLALNQIVR